MPLSRLAYRTALLSAASSVSIMIAGPALAQSQTQPVDQNTNPGSTNPPQDASAGQDAGTSMAVVDPQSPDDGDAIVVTGIRASQQRAVNIKRNAASIVDAISAEDIGKLPDNTISDSLQRIPGVQIRRSAGEGSSVNIRGLPQVTTTLNGEEFLGAQSITTVQPNFSDIPSQLFAGADVIKSPTADLLDAGITGTVNLRTRRPFDLKNGLTMAAAAEGSYGDKTEKYDPNFNGLVAYRGDRFGILVSAAYANQRLSNSHNGIQEGYGATLHNERYLVTDDMGTADTSDDTNNGGDVNLTNGFSPPNRPHGTPMAGGIDINGDGDVTDAFIVPQGFTGWNRITQRKRLGINGSVQWEPTDSIQVTGDAFFTKQTAYDRTAGFQMQNINWQAGEFVPGQTRDTGALSYGPDGTEYNINSNQIYNYDLGAFDSYAQTDRYKQQSQNYSLEMKFDNGGPFKMTLRGVYGKAHDYYNQSYLQFALNNGVQWHGGIGHYPGGDLAFNPDGYTVSTVAGPNSLPVTVDYTGNTATFDLPEKLLSEIGNIQDYALKTISSENNYRRKGDLKIVRADGSYQLTDAITMTFGARYNERSIDQYTFERAAPLYAGSASNPDGCLVKWKAFDVQMSDSTCSAGDAAGFFTAGLTRKGDDPSFNGQVKQFNVHAPGVPDMFVLDPHAMDDAVAFQNSFYPGNVEVMIPGSTYNVGVKQISGYTQMNFEGDLFGLPFVGNAGLKVINTRLDIQRHVTGDPRPYGLPNTDGGIEETKRNFTDFLPAFNVAVNFTDDLKLRMAFAKTMTLLNLDQWGGGLTPGYAIENQPGGGAIFRVTGGSQTGNPLLDPWRATNVDLSLEYYIGSASLLSLGGFYIDVDSFIQSGSIIRTDLPDNDGVVRNRRVSITTPIQGQGGTLKGIEGGAKLAFTDFAFVPTFLSNFGVDANFTFSPSDSGQTDLAGNSIPFQDNSKWQTNLAGFYQDSQFQVRVAWNYRSKRAVQSDFGGITGLELYQQPTNYVDASVSYDITPNFTLYAQGSNLTGEYEKYYLTWKDQRAYNNIYERRYTAGVRVKF